MHGRLAAGEVNREGAELLGAFCAVLQVLDRDWIAYLVVFVAIPAAQIALPRHYQLAVPRRVHPALSEVNSHNALTRKRGQGVLPSLEKIKGKSRTVCRLWRGLESGAGLGKRR